MKIYLAHPFNSRKKWKKWQDSHPELDITNPFYGLQKERMKLIDAGRRTRYSVHPKSIIEMDLDSISSADLVVAIIDGKKSYGTIMEMAYARMMGKPVCALITNGEERHIWLRYHTDRIFKTEKGLIRGIQCSMKSSKR